MIAYLDGILVAKLPHAVILRTPGGVGYEVWVSQRTLTALPFVGEEATLWTHTQVTQDALTLVGFRDLTERTLYLELTQVQGIGPKLALGILSQLEVGDLVRAVRSKDLATLKTLTGVGKKTAERILLELAEKPSFLLLPGGDGPVDGDPAVGPDAEALLDQLRQALENLGYRRKEIDPVIRRLAPEVATLKGIEAAVLRALALMGG